MRFGSETSTFHIILYVAGWLVLQGVFLFIFLSFVDRLDTKHPFAIGEGGRRSISFGFPFIAIAVLLCKGMALDRFVTAKFNENVFPYVFFGALIMICLGASLLYKYIPKRLGIRLGIIGYVVGFSLLYWYFVFTDPLQH